MNVGGIGIDTGENDLMLLFRGKKEKSAFQFDFQVFDVSILEGIVI